MSADTQSSQYVHIVESVADTANACMSVRVLVNDGTTKVVSMGLAELRDLEASLNARRTARQINHVIRKASDVRKQLAEREEERKHRSAVAWTAYLEHALHLITKRINNNTMLDLEFTVLTKAPHDNGIDIMFTDVTSTLIVEALNRKLKALECGWCVRSVQYDMPASVVDVCVQAEDE